MKLFQYCILFFVAFPLFSCSVNTEESGVVIIDANVNSSWKPFRSSLFVDNIQYIPICCSDSLLLNNSIRCCRGFYYDIDRCSQQILRISEEGLIVAKIGSQGRTTREYIDITTYDVNPLTSEVYVYDGTSNRLVVYSCEGEFKRSIDLFASNSLFRDMVVFPNGNIMGCAFDYNGPLAHRGVWLLNPDGSFIKEIVSVKKSVRFDVLTQLPLFSRIDDNSVAVMGSVGDDTVYIINSEGMITDKYRFCFGAPISRKELRNEMNPNTPFNFFFKNSLFASSNWIRILGSINNSIRAFSYDIKNGVLYGDNGGYGTMINDSGYVGGIAIGDNRSARVINREEAQELFDSFPEGVNQCIVITHLKN